jgi:cell division protein FtsL
MYKIIATDVMAINLIVHCMLLFVLVYTAVEMVNSSSSVMNQLFSPTSL